jgi:hypothetical protein
VRRFFVLCWRLLWFDKYSILMWRVCLQLVQVANWQLPPDLHNAGAFAGLNLLHISLI